MVVELKNNRIIIVMFFITLAVLNAIQNIYDGLGPLNLLTYSGFFVVVSLIYFVVDVRFSKICVLFYLEFIIGFFAEIFGSPGIGIAMYLLSFKHMSKNKTSMLITIPFVVVSIGLRFYVSGYTLSLIFNQILLHAYMFYRWGVEYYSLINQKKISLKEIDVLTELERQIIEYQLEGKTYKEISFLLDRNIKPVSIRGRAAKARRKLGCETTSEMIIKLARSGMINNL